MQWFGTILQNILVQEISLKNVKYINWQVYKQMYNVEIAFYCSLYFWNPSPCFLFFCYILCGYSHLHLTRSALVVLNIFILDHEKVMHFWPWLYFSIGQFFVDFIQEMKLTLQVWVGSGSNVGTGCIEHPAVWRPDCGLLRPPAHARTPGGPHWTPSPWPHQYVWHLLRAGARAGRWGYWGKQEGQG